MATYFTSDTHIDHGNIIKYSNRPFLCSIDAAALAARNGVWGEHDKHKISEASCNLMTEALINNTNAVVGRNDVLFHLGDVAGMTPSKYAESCKKYRNGLNCREVHLVYGNHDLKSKIPDSLFSSCRDFADISVEGQRIVLCHYAMAVWNRSHRGSWHLYGHSHGSAEEWLDKVMPGRKSIDVGVDNAVRVLGEYRPFSFGELKCLFDKKAGSVIDQHR